jgi:hypothetical protein
MRADRDVIPDIDAIARKAPLALVAAALLALVAAALLASCGPRVEYRARPGYASSEDLPDEIVLDDGTIIRYVPLSEFLARKKAREEGRGYKPPSSGAVAVDPSKPLFRPWDELENGTVRMDAIMPEQVVANAMRAFREERYGELWDQLVAESVRRRAAAESGPDAARARFIAWCAKNRSEAMMLLNRMSFAFSTNGVVMQRAGGNMLQMTLTPQVVKEFKLRVVEVVYETTEAGERVKLAGIR